MAFVMVMPGRMARMPIGGRKPATVGEAETAVATGRGPIGLTAAARPIGASRGIPPGRRVPPGGAATDVGGAEPDEGENLTAAPTSQAHAKRLKVRAKAKMAAGKMSRADHDKIVARADKYL